MTIALGVLALAIGVAHIIADYRHAWRAAYVLKPLTMIAIIAVLLASPGDAATLRRWVLLGLGLSLVGDVLLMLRPARFVGGLAAFLLAHLAYGFGFLAATTQPWWPALGPVAIAGLVMLRVLRPGLGRLHAAVALYVTGIVLMVWLALSLWHEVGTRASALIAIGALLFMASDAVLGYARFRHRFAAAQGIILGAYYLAQVLIASGAGTLNLIFA